MNPQELPQVEMIACEGCGGYHKKEECEVIVIKIIKGKNCQIPLVRKNTVVPVAIPSTSFTAQSTPAVPTGVPVAASEVPAVPTEPKKNIIPTNLKPRYVGGMPNAMMGIMMDPSNPNFESKGDKEIRKV